jgi:hypothetical protein
MLGNISANFNDYTSIGSLDSPANHFVRHLAHRRLIRVCMLFVGLSTMHGAVGRSWMIGRTAEMKSRFAGIPIAEQATAGLGKRVGCWHCFAWLIGTTAPVAAVAVAANDILRDTDAASNLGEINALVKQLADLRAIRSSGKAVAAAAAG